MIKQINIFQRIITTLIIHIPALLICIYSDNRDLMNIFICSIIFIMIFQVINYLYIEYYNNYKVGDYILFYRYLYINEQCISGKILSIVRNEDTIYMYDILFIENGKQCNKLIFCEDIKRRLKKNEKEDFKMLSDISMYNL